ncbi:MAG: hypothetical protein MUF77_11410 [Leptospira sp.]|nr:hypothetical protein [Leptospira sp.]
MDTYRLQKKIIEYLDNRAGKTVTRQEIKNKFIESVELRKPDPKIKKGKTPKRREKIPRREIEMIIDQLLHLLMQEGLVVQDKKLLLVASPFRLTGRISISRRGDGFVTLPTKSEIFIPGPLTNTAISGDKVQILPIAIGKRDRLEGEVTEILKRGRILYRMRVREKTNKFIFGSFLDMLGEEKEGVLHTKSLLKDTLDTIQVGDILVVKFKEGSPPQDNLYDVSSRLTKNPNEVQL